MRLIIIITTLLIFNNTIFCQTTLIPDPMFEQELINQGYDIGPIDGVVYTDSINTISIFSIWQTTITNLTGIEDFSSLSELYCFDNQLTSLDLSNNNQLTVLDCRSNDLTCLNVKNANNTNFTTFETIPNLNLNCIEVDDTSWSNSNWLGGVLTGTIFSTSCGNNCSTLNIDENELTSINVHPNPTRDIIFIDIPNSQAQTLICLSNGLGQVIYKNKIDNGSTSIDLQNLSNGTYFVKLESPNDGIKMIKVIKL